MGKALQRPEKAGKTLLVVHVLKMFFSIYFNFFKVPPKTSLSGSVADDPSLIQQSHI